MIIEDFTKWLIASGTLEMTLSIIFKRKLFI